MIIVSIFIKYLSCLLQFLNSTEAEDEDFAYALAKLEKQVNLLR